MHNCRFEILIIIVYEYSKLSSYSAEILKHINISLFTQNIILAKKQKHTKPMPSSSIGMFGFPYILYLKQTAALQLHSAYIYY